jgi:hypothetical protein
MELQGMAVLVVEVAEQPILEHLVKAVGRHLTLAAMVVLVLGMTAETAETILVEVVVGLVVR